MFEFLFIDLDDTILDFKKAEHIALQKTLTDFDVEPTGERCALYSRINQQHWQALERGELTRAQVLVGRFATLFDRLGVQADAEACAARYAENLSVGHYFLPGAREAVERLSRSYKLYLASNGTKKVQASRLESANISGFFEDIFISQDMGADKPSKAYFDRCFARIPGFAPQRAMIVGDSLSSDIQGGINAGIATCWVNPDHKPRSLDIRADYEIESLSHLEALLKTL